MQCELVATLKIQINTPMHKQLLKMSSLSNLYSSADSLVSTWWIFANMLLTAAAVSWILKRRWIIEGH